MYNTDSCLSLYIDLVHRCKKETFSVISMWTVESQVKIQRPYVLD